MNDYNKLFRGFTIIPSVRRLRDFDYALKSYSNIVFLSEVHIGNLGPLVKRLQNSGKLAFVNADLIGGFDADPIGIKLLKDLFHVDGIISSNSRVINISKSIELYTIQRFFLIDSRGLDSGLKALKTSRSDAVEILPGALSIKFKDEVRKVKDVPLLGGGFIKDKATILNIYNSGFMGVTTSQKELWNDYSYLKQNN